MIHSDSLQRTQAPVITLGSAVVDVFVTSSAFVINQQGAESWLCQRYGDKVELDSLELFSGGGATNVAVALTRLGVSAQPVAELGKDAFSQIIVSDLEAEGVGTEFLVHEKKEQTGGSVILVGEDGGRTILVHRGAAGQLDVEDLPEPALSQARWWHVSSVAGRQLVLKRLMQLAIQHQIGWSWNPGQSELELLVAGGLPLADVQCQLLFLNKEEWHVISPVHDQLRRQLPVIIVTDGAKGGQVLTPDGEVDFQAHSTESVDDTGAGDAFAAGCLAAHLSGHSLSTAMQWGAHSAAAVVQKQGAKTGLLTKAQLDALQ